MKLYSEILKIVPGETKIINCGKVVSQKDIEHYLCEAGFHKTY